MKVAMVSFDIYEGNSTGLYPPLHLCALATSLQAAGYEAKVYDYAESFKGIHVYFKEIQEFQPDVIGLTCYTPSLGLFHRLTKQLRNYIPEAAMVVGGAHATVWPEKTLEDMVQFDYAMMGECDRSIVAFADMMDGKKDKTEVPGLVYREDNKILKNQRDFIKNLNELPQINRMFLDKYYKSAMYWDMAASGSLDMMITSRGCSYDCTFCFKLERISRFRNADHVMTEFETLRSRDVKSIHIQDDAFTTHKRRCMEIANRLIEEKYNFKLKIRSRVNSINEEILKKLKKANVQKIIYGFESGSQTMLDSMNKRTTVEMNMKAIAMTKKAGIACYGEIMIGLPGETRETINETIAFLLKTKPIIGFVPVLYPLPSTKVYIDAQKKGTLQGDWKVDGPSPWVKLPWTTSKKDLEIESWRISKTIQRDPGTIFYFLKCHLKTMSWNQIKVLFSIFKMHFIK